MVAQLFPCDIHGLLIRNSSFAVELLALIDTSNLFNMKHRSYSVPKLCSLMLLFSLSSALDCLYGHDKSFDWDMSKDNKSDREEMKKLAKALHFQEWHANENWDMLMSDEKSMCDIDNVCCEKMQDGSNRISELKLERNNLKGRIPDTFYRLSNAKIVEFHLNFVTNFPDKLDQMPQLRQAKFGRNPICGQLPKWKFGPQLTKVNCNFCCLEGNFPDIFYNLPLLEESYWDGNAFTGSLPESLNNLTGLTKVSFNLNSFTGKIPEKFCALPLLTDCRIGSDTNFDPYDTSKNSPERAWLFKNGKPIWNGNIFECPIPDTCKIGACRTNASMPTSPIKCS